MKTLATALLALAAAVSPAAAADTARTSAVLAYYDGPGEDYTRLGKLPMGAEIELIRCNRRDWCLFADANGEPAGWVRSGYLIGAAALLKARPAPRLGIDFGVVLGP